MNYGYKRRVEGSFNVVLNKVRNALEKGGFGILSQINAKSVLKKNLHVKFNNYTIIGACNSSYGYRILQTELEAGLFLPCSVVVYEDNNVVFVAILKQDLIFGIVDNPKLKGISKEVDKKLKNIVDNL